MGDCVATDSAQSASMCYDGSYTRTVKCFDELGTERAPADCETAVGPAPPATNGACQEKSQCSFTWQCSTDGSTFESCTTENYYCAASDLANPTCSAGTLTRQVKCLSNVNNFDGAAADCEAAEGPAPPPTSGACQVTSGCSGVWVCSADDSVSTIGLPKCEKTDESTGFPVCREADIPTRAVRCAHPESTEAAPLTGVCLSSDKPVEQLPTLRECAKVWRCAAVDGVFTSATLPCTDVSTWGECTLTCPTAAKTRVAKCINELDVVVENACGEAPVVEEACELAPQFQGITVDSTVVVNNSYDVDWCFYNAGQAGDVTVTVTLYPASSYPVLLGSVTAPAGANSLTVSIPVVPSTQAHFTLQAGAVTAESQTITVAASCDAELFCGEQGTCNTDTSKCDCANGFTGEQCAENPCGKCSSNSVCSADTLYKCECTAGFGGDYCEIKTDCSNDQCKNDGYVANIDGTCSSDCVCRNEWSGLTCEVCDITCTDATRGTHDLNCEKCVCNRGYSGDACECRQVFGGITLPGASASVLTDGKWQAALKRSVITLTGLAESEVMVSVPVASKPVVVITLTSCPAPSPVAVQSPLSNLYEMWALVTSDLQSETSVLKTTVFSTTTLGASVTPTASEQVYDPTCTGDGCATGTDPAPSTNASTKAFMSALTIGMVMMLAVIALVF